MTVRKLGGATIEKVEEICGAGFKAERMFPNFDQEAFDAQKGWMLPDHVEPVRLYEAYLRNFEIESGRGSL